MKVRSNLLVSLFLVAWMWATVAVFLLSMLSPASKLLTRLPASAVIIHGVIAEFFSAAADVSF